MSIVFYNNPRKSISKDNPELYRREFKSLLFIVCLKRKYAILTCKKEWFDGDPNENKKVHFDINHLNIIVWEPDELDVFKTALTDRIVAIMGKGSFVIKN